MKRIAMLILTAVLLVCAVSGFKTIDKRAVDIRDCTLHDEEINLRIFPGSHYQPNSVTLRVSVNDGERVAAIGSRRIELLKVPAEGVSFRIPLSERLRLRKKYSIEVDIDSQSDGSTRLDWSNVDITGISSGGFFEKNFKPITEPSDLRNQISMAGIRRGIR